MEFQYMKSTESKSPALADFYVSYLDSFREMCDFCMTPRAAARAASFSARTAALRASASADDSDADADDIAAALAASSDASAAASAAAAAATAYYACHDDDGGGDDDDDDEPEYGYFTSTNANKIEYQRDYARLVLDFYNDTKLKNFKLVKLCKFNTGGIFLALTFTAREDENEECSLFRGAIHGAGLVKPVFCEIKDDDKVTLLPADDDYVSEDTSFICRNQAPDDYSSHIQGSVSCVLFIIDQIKERSSEIQRLVQMNSPGEEIKVRISPLCFQGIRYEFSNHLHGHGICELQQRTRFFLNQI